MSGVSVEYPLSLPLAILAPLLTAMFSFLFRVRGSWLPAAGALATVAAAADLVWRVAAGGPQVHHLGGWQPPLGIELYADGLAVLMVALTAVVGLGVVLYAGPYLAGKQQPRRLFWPIWMIQWAALNTLFLSADLFNLYVCLELLMLSAVGLAAFAGDRASLAAALRYMFLALLGSLAYLLGVALLYGGTGSLHLREVGEALSPGGYASIAAALMTAGLVAKAAIFPLHIWLMPAHSNAPAPVSAVLSALVAKAAVYLLLRLWLWTFPELMTAAIASLIGALGGAAILYGSVQALRQARVKQIIAFSTVAQLGYLLLLLPLAVSPAAAAFAWQGAAYHVLAHGLAKAACFLAAGNIIYAMGHDRIDGLRGLSPYLSVSVMALGVALVSLMGLPPSGGFLAKWQLLSAAFVSGQWWWVLVVVLGGLLAAGYAFRLLAMALAMPPRGWVEVHPVRRLPPVMEWVPMVLALAALALGLSAVPALQLLDIGAPVRFTGGAE